MNLMKASSMLALAAALPSPPYTPSGRRDKTERRGTSKCDCGRTISANKDLCRACAERNKVRKIDANLLIATDRIHAQIRETLEAK